LTARVPPHSDRASRIGWLYYGVLVYLQAGLFSTFDKVVAKVTVAGQPHAAFDHREISTQAPQMQRVAACYAVDLTTLGGGTGNARRRQMRSRA